MSVHPKDFVAKVRNQYEALPYPFREVARERGILYGNEALSLSALSHVNWAGKRDLRENARFLIAGHGTGDTLIFLAEQLRGHKADIIGIDISQKSAEIARERLAKRGLNNVQFIHASILDLPDLDLGLFDVIECGGVLHHLADPDAGLRALNAMLTDDGIMEIMVYGHYGRLAVYMVQEMMHSLITPEMSHDEQVTLCKEFLQAIPNGHWLMYNNENFKVDIREPSGAGIYDLFLHPQDRAYTVPQIYDWLKQAGLLLQHFHGWQVGELAYDPKEYTASKALHKQFDALDEPERHRVAELMHGHMNRHMFYAVKHKKEAAKLADDMVIHFGSEHRHEPGFIARVAPLIAKTPLGQRYIEEYKSVDAPALIITKNKLTHHILQLIDGRLNIRQIYDALLKQGVIVQDNDASYQAYMHDVSALFTELYSRMKAFLRHDSITPYITVPEMIARLENIAEDKTYQGTF
jgi:SAM-dependent methyltransferase